MCVGDRLRLHGCYLGWLYGHLFYKAFGTHNLQPEVSPFLETLLNDSKVTDTPFSPDMIVECVFSFASTVTDTYYTNVDTEDLFSQLQQLIPKTATLMRVSIRDNGISFETNQVHFRHDVEKHKHPWRFDDTHT